MTTIRTIFEQRHILERVFKELNRVDCAHTARVCKAWSDAALDALWRELNGYELVGLFSLLAPLDSDENGLFVLSSLPNATTWTTFESHCKRVRTLRFDNSEAGIHKSIFDTIAYEFRSLCFFPNLNVLECTVYDESELRYSTIFVNRNIKNFTMVFAFDNASTSFLFFASYVQKIAARMPSLEGLSFQSGQLDWDGGLETALNLSITQLTSLKTLILPSGYLTDPIIQTLSQFRQLRKLSHSGDLASRGESSTAVSPVQPGSFPALEEFSIVSGLSHLGSLLTSQDSFKVLTCLTVKSSKEELPPDVRSLLCCLSTSCQLLTRLSICASKASRLADSPTPNFDQQLSFQTIRPMIRLSNLVHFTISHHFPIIIHDKDIEEIAQQLPSLMTFRLGEAPSFLAPPTLTLKSLQILAERCPQLTSIGLYLNVDSVPKLEQTARFQKLDDLYLGTSPIVCYKAKDVALFLSRLCRSNYVIRSTFALSFEGSEELIKWVDQWHMTWDSVRDLVSVAIKHREEWMQLERTESQAAN